MSKIYMKSKNKTYHNLYPHINNHLGVTPFLKLPKVGTAYGADFKKAVVSSRAHGALFCH